MRVDRADLRVGKKLGEGSQGVVYRAELPGRALPFTSLIYKEFDRRTSVSGPALEVLTALRDGLTEAERAVIDAYTVWPAIVVEDGGRISGYLMQEIPPQYLQTIATSAGQDVIPREVQHLFVADAITQRNLGETPTRLERFALCREMAFALGFLHGRNVVFGDLSYKNAVYCLRPTPTVMLLDCDAVRVQGQGSAVPQLNSPGWTAPEKGPQTKQTDRYKLGLFVLRCCTPEVNAQTRDPSKAAAVLDATGMGLLRRALGDDPDQRTSGKEWVAYFDGVLARAGGVAVRRNPAPAPPSPSYRLARPGEAGHGAGRQPSVPRPAPRPVVAPQPVRVPVPVYPAPSPPPWVPPVRHGPTVVPTGFPPPGAGNPSIKGWQWVAALWATAIALLFLTVAFGGGRAPESLSRPTVLGTTERPDAAASTVAATVASSPRALPVSNPAVCPASNTTPVAGLVIGSPPPVCVDPGRQYAAEMETTVGPIRMLLRPGPSDAVNLFVLLARYGAYDDEPFDARLTVLPRAELVDDPVARGSGARGTADAGTVVLVPGGGVRVLRAPEEVGADAVVGRVEAGLDVTLPLLGPDQRVVRVTVREVGS